jgi:hypothetical protein
MVIETGRGVGYWVEQPAGPAGPAGLPALDAFGVVHDGQPVILAGPTQEGALLTTKTLDHLVTVLAAARRELGFGQLDERHTDVAGIPIPPRVP